jgi:hypothetical protein
MKKIVNPLTPGDVIQTHPARGYWGCAVVLTARDSTATSWPICHIATTSLITRKKYAWKDIDPAGLEIAKLTYDVRVAPNEYYRQAEPRTCIGMYVLKSAAGLSIIGRMDPNLLHPAPLTFKVGDGTNGCYPSCGRIPEDLGDQAVTAWRMVHDKERFDRESAKEMALFERLDSKLRAEDRAARQARKARREGGH